MAVELAVGARERRPAAAQVNVRRNKANELAGGRRRTVRAAGCGEMLVEHDRKRFRFTRVACTGVRRGSHGRFVIFVHDLVAILLEPLVVEQQRFVEFGNHAIERLARQNLACGAGEFRLDVDHGVLAGKPPEDGNQCR